MIMPIHYAGLPSTNIDYVCSLIGKDGLAWSYRLEYVVNKIHFHSLYLWVTSCKCWRPMGEKRLTIRIFSCESESSSLYEGGYVYLENTFVDDLKTTLRECMQHNYRIDIGSLLACIMSRHNGRRHGHATPPPNISTGNRIDSWLHIEGLSISSCVLCHP